MPQHPHHYIHERIAKRVNRDSEYGEPELTAQDVEDILDEKPGLTHSNVVRNAVEAEAADYGII